MVPWLGTSAIIGELRDEYNISTTATAWFIVATQVGYRERERERERGERERGRERGRERREGERERRERAEI